MHESPGGEKPFLGLACHMDVTCYIRHGPVILSRSTAYFLATFTPFDARRSTHCIMLDMAGTGLPSQESVPEEA